MKPWRKGHVHLPVVDGGCDPLTFSVGSGEEWITDLAEVNDITCPVCKPKVLRAVWKDGYEKGVDDNEGHHHGDFIVTPCPFPEVTP